MRKYLELVEGSFTQEHFDKQEAQHPYVAYSIQDGEVIFNIIKEGDLYTILKLTKGVPNSDYQAVDLGLPSGLKWADRNVGATSPEDGGSYFLWGTVLGYTINVSKVTAEELVEIVNSTMGGNMLTIDNLGDFLSTYGFANNDLTTGGFGGYQDCRLLLSFDAHMFTFHWMNYFDTNDSGSTFNKYATDKLNVLEVVDDAAYSHMGSHWRMPTSTEMQELVAHTIPTFIDLNSNEFTQEEAWAGLIPEGDLKGVKLTSIVNGNSIFLPASGYHSLIESKSLYFYGKLWSSRLTDHYSNSARILEFSNYSLECCDDYDSRYENRCLGIPIRGVCN